MMVVGTVRVVEGRGMVWVGFWVGDGSWLSFEGREGKGKGKGNCPLLACLPEVLSCPSPAILQIMPGFRAFRYCTNLPSC